LRAAGLIREAEMFASALRMIALGMSVLEIEQGDGVTANAVEISKRLDGLKSLLRNRGTSDRKVFDSHSRK
jgi:hypothetical protein